MTGRCERCGSPGSPSGAAASCAACRGPARPSAAGALIAAASWLSATGRGSPGGNLGAILLGYRHAGGLTQQHLADLLGFDRTYISMIETGRRSVTDSRTLTHIARTLAIPPHVLGIAGPDDADFTAMLAFGTSVIRLADVARHSGRAADAVSELWPLIIRLEARVAAGHAEPETMRLLALARVSFGVALGHLLPEEQLATAARWTGRALRIAWDLGDRELLASVLRMHGNELRKAGHVMAGVVRLRQSLQIDDHPARKSTTTPGRLGRDEIYQLAGYLLLDYPDEFGISRVGLYLSRQGATITWDAGEFLQLLGCASPLPELRDQLRRHLTACRARLRSTDAHRIAAAHLGRCPQ
jgi:transcriptional regulator with XRE-family HTH domain